MIQYVLGDATYPVGESPRVIVHVCNDMGGWGRGFVLAISSRWSEPEQDYRDWFDEGPRGDFRLGAVRFVEVEPSLWVANLIGQHKTRPIKNAPPIRYEALREGLRTVRQFCKSNQASVHMPRIGCGLAGGRWKTVSAIIEDELITQGIPVTVYDLP